MQNGRQTATTQGWLISGGFLEVVQRVFVNSGSSPRTPERAKQAAPDRSYTTETDAQVFSTGSSNDQQHDTNNI